MKAVFPELIDTFRFTSISVNVNTSFPQIIEKECACMNKCQFQGKQDSRHYFMTSFCENSIVAKTSLPFY